MCHAIAFAGPFMYLLSTALLFLVLSARLSAYFNLPEAMAVSWQHLQIAAYWLVWQAGSCQMNFVLW